MYDLDDEECDLC